MRVDVRPNITYRSTGMPIERRGSNRNYDPVIHQRQSYDDYPADAAGRRYSTSPRYPPLPDPEVEYDRFGSSRWDRVRREEAELNERRFREELKERERIAADRRDRDRRDRRIEAAGLYETQRERDYRIGEMARELERERVGRGGRREYGGR